MRTARNLIGNKFGRYTVMARVSNDFHGGPQWICQCDCGTVRVVRGGNLRSGKSQSCGCWRGEQLANLNATPLKARPVKTAIRDGREQSLIAWAKELGISYSTLNVRFNKGMRGEELFMARPPTWLS